MKHLLLSLAMLATLCVPLSAVVPVHAQVFDGPGLEGGVGEAGNIQGPVKKTLREAVIDLMRKVLNFMALAAVVVIVIAGLSLIVGQGSDDSKNKAKNIILFAIVGLLVIFFARAVVGFISSGNLI